MQSAMPRAMPSPLGRCQGPRNALGSALSMRPAIILLTTFAFVSAGCAPPSVPVRNATSVTLASASVAAPPPGAAPNPAPSPDATPTTPPPPPPADAPPASQSIPNDARGSAVMPRTIGWFSIGIGATAALVAIGTSIMMLNQLSIRNSDCNAQKLCSADGLTANSQLQGLGGWNTGAYVVAAVGLALGAYLVITNPAKSKDEMAIGVSPTNSGAAFSLRSTF
jgi:hypothetical protein